MKNLNHQKLGQDSLDTKQQSKQYTERRLENINTNEINLEIVEHRFDNLRNIDIIAYGVGHFLNDLTASFWFNYALFYLIRIVKTDAAGFAFLMGQITDAIVTPLIGYISDHIKTQYGQRTLWYTIGYIITLFTFPLIFWNVKYQINPQAEYYFYGLFASLFNVGWAFVQINHLSLVPSLSCSKFRQQKLNNLRNTFGFFANFLLLLIVSTISSLLQNYQTYFFYMAILVILIGSCTSIFFISVIDEIKITSYSKNQRQKILNSLKIQIPESKQNGQFRWYYWLKKPKFYLFGIAYIAARLSVNMMTTLLPFFIRQNQQNINTPYILLILYLSSIIISFKTKSIVNIFGKRWILLIGVLFSIFASIILFINSDQQIKFLIFLASIFVGISQAIILNSVINFICQVIGSKSDKGGSVFGIYSFFDKIITGIVIYMLTKPKNINNPNFIENVILIIPPCLGIISCIFICMGIPTQVKTKNQEDPEYDAVLNELVI